MQIFVNGTLRDITASTTARDLVNTLKLEMDGLVVVINDAVVPAPALAQTQFQEKDRLDLVRMVGGG